MLVAHDPLLDLQACFGAGIDVVANETHALDAVDAAFRPFVGVPVLQASSLADHLDGRPH